MMRPPCSRARLAAPWFALLLFGCAAGPSEEEHDPSFVEESDLDESILLERALQQESPPAHQGQLPADDGAATSELARLLQDRLAAYVPSAADGGPPQPVDDQVVSELAATLDRSLELAQQLLAEDASVPHEARAAPHESAAP